MEFLVRRSSTWTDVEPIDEAKEIKDKNNNKHWIVEIKDLKQLIKIYEKYGNLIICEPCTKIKGYPYEIEIYDDYRE